MRHSRWLGQKLAAFDVAIAKPQRRPSDASVPSLNGASPRRSEKAEVAMRRGFAPATPTRSEPSCLRPDILRRSRQRGLGAAVSSCPKRDIASRMAASKLCKVTGLLR